MINNKNKNCISLKSKRNWLLTQIIKEQRKELEHQYYSKTLNMNKYEQMAATSKQTLNKSHILSYSKNNCSKKNYQYKTIY